MSAFLRKKFGGAIDGLDLVAAQPVAIILEKHSLEYEFQEQVPYPFPNEIILKCINAGLGTLDDISEFTGLDEDLVALFLAEEIYEGNISHSSGSYRLTAAGEKLLRDVVKRVVKTQREAFAWDTLAGRLVRKPSRDRNLEDLQEQEPEILALPALSPSKPMRKAPRTKFTPEDLGPIFGNERAILRVTKQRFVGDIWATPATLLVYTDSGATQSEFRLVIDGEESENHRAALNSRDFREAFQVKIEPQEIPEDASMMELEPLKLASPKRFDELQEVLPKVQFVADEDPDAMYLVGKSESNTPSLVRQFSVFEHRPFLEQALLNSKRRLLIVSPWITSKVVNGQFELDLTKLVERGVEVDIVYGIKDDQRSSAEAIKRLCTLAKIYPNFRFYRHENNHSKVLIADDTVITTSFNWLSFRGDQALTFRREEGTLVQGQIYADSYYAGWQELVMSECQPACNL